VTTTTDRPLPPVTDRATWQARIDELRVREKAHTRAGDALAAERRRLPMVGVDAQTMTLDGRPTAQWPRVAAGRSDDLAAPGH